MTPLTEDSSPSYRKLEEDDTAAKKGGLPNERLTVDMARQIVADVLGRRDMARKRKSDEDEIDALVDDLDDELEDVEEEEEEEDVEEDEDEEEEEEEEDPDEAPKKARRGRKAKTAKKKAAPEKVGVGTVEVAEAAGIEPRQLRMYLRDKGIQGGDSREGRYNWPSLESKEVKRIISDIRKGAVDKLNKEKLANLKGRKKSTTKKSAAKKRTKVRSQKK